LSHQIEAIENDFILRKKRINRTSGARGAKAASVRFVLVVAFLVAGVGFTSAILTPERKNEPNAPMAKEFIVNTYTPSDQTHPKVARTNDGTSVVVWSSWEQVGAGYQWDVYAQVYNGAGVAIGGELDLNDVTTLDQGGDGDLDVGICSPAVNQATFIAVWGSVSVASAYDVVAQKYNIDLIGSTVTADGPNRVVNTYLTGNQGGFGELVSVSMDTKCKYGAFTWGTSGESDATPHNDSAGDIFIREFVPHPFLWADSQEWRANTNITEKQYDPEVSVNGDGIYLACWGSLPTWFTNGYEIMARRFYWTSDDTIDPRNDQKDFNASQISIAADDKSPTCSLLDTGEFAVGWTTNVNQAVSGLDVYGVGYTPLGRCIYPPPEQMTNYIAGDQYDTSISSNHMDTWVWTWTSDGQDGSYAGIYGWMSSDIAYKGDDFRASQWTLGNQSFSDISMSSDGTYFIAWANWSSPKDVYGRIFNNIPNVPELSNGWTVPGIFILSTASIIFLRKKRVQKD